MMASEVNAMGYSIVHVEKVKSGALRGPPLGELVNEFVIQVDGLVFDDGAADGIGIMDADAVGAGKRLVQRTL